MHVRGRLRLSGDHAAMHSAARSHTSRPSPESMRREAWLEAGIRDMHAEWHDRGHETGTAGSASSMQRRKAEIRASVPNDLLVIAQARLARARAEEAHNQEVSDL